VPHQDRVRVSGNTISPALIEQGNTFGEIVFPDTQYLEIGEIVFPDTQYLEILFRQLSSNKEILSLGLYLKGEPTVAWSVVRRVGSALQACILLSESGAGVHPDLPAQKPASPAHSMKISLN